MERNEGGEVVRRIERKEGEAVRRRERGSEEEGER
jgi:hypothetical protein